ncbi:MAG: hypothetical protein PHF00_04275 [Elusimicrobia bacterium]|nr:hypothetical protein [Elusimicrobiota bacterium]
MKTLLLGLLLLFPAAAAAEKFSLHDEGEFQPLGQRVEFYDRFGWRGYAVDFDFGLDEESRALSRNSRLVLRIRKRDGGTWTYACKASGRQALSANVNFLYGKGISIVADCRIDEKAFAKAVGLHPEDVGVPNLVFHAMIRDGKVYAGAQRGIYFAPSAEAEASELSPYASGSDDPTSLAVVFQSLQPIQ